MVKRELPCDINTLARMTLLARAEGVQLKPMSRTKVDMIAYRDGSAGRYIVSGDSCTCPAYQMRGSMCKHRAAWIEAHIDEYATSVFAACDEYERLQRKEGA